VADDYSGGARVTPPRASITHPRRLHNCADRASPQQENAATHDVTHVPVRYSMPDAANLVRCALSSTATR